MSDKIKDAAEKYAENKSSSEVFRQAHINDFTSGALWMLQFQPQPQLSDKDIEKLAEKETYVDVATNSELQIMKQAFIKGFKAASLSSRNRF